MAASDTSYDTVLRAGCSDRAPGNLTPATYEVPGRQSVAIAAGGRQGRRATRSGQLIWRRYVAFALRR
jgi:hypothetical protein